MIKIEVKKTKKYKDGIIMHLRKKYVKGNLALAQAILKKID